MIGKQAIVPICDRKVPVIADPYVDVGLEQDVLR